MRGAIPPSVPVFHVELAAPRWAGEQNYAGYVGCYREEIAKYSAEVARARINRDWKFARLVDQIEEANRYCQFFGLPDRFEMPADFEALRKDLAKIAAAKAKLERERKKQIERANAEHIQAWCADEKEYFPYAIDRVYLRVEGEEVVTSRGARFPLEHARRGLKFVRGVRESGQEYKRNGHTFHLGHYAIDKVDSEGNVTAGCHYVLYEEIERIAPQIEKGGAQ